MNATIKDTIRYCNDIDMFAIDRPVITCKHATSFCAKHCFNVKLYKAFGHGMNPKDVKNEQAWGTLTGSELAKVLAKKRNQTKRVRLMTRGEAISTASDIDKIIDIANNNKTSVFWVPTRAWRNAELRDLIEEKLFPLKNLRLQASLDPSNSEQEVQSLIAAGWSTMFFGDDTATDNRKKCPKTWNHANGHCSKCTGGCFSAKQTHVHLKQH